MEIPEPDVHKPTSSEISLLISLCLAILGALGSFIATLDRFGVVGSLLIASAILLIAGGLSSGFGLTQLDSCLRRWRLSRPYSIIPTVIAIVGFLVALILWVTGKGELRWRYDYATFHNNLAIHQVDFATDSLLGVSTKDAESQQYRERQNMNKWLAWMVDGANKEIQQDMSAGSTGAKTISRSLVHVESVPFDSCYDTLQISAIMTPSAKVKECIAFLVSGIEKEPWWKGTWRQMRCIVDQSGRKVDIIATRPNKGEVLMLLLTIEPTGNELPPRDRLIPAAVLEIGS